MPEYIETGTEPEFYITELRTEAAGGGNIRILAYNLRHGALYLVYTAIMPAAAAPNCARQVLAASHNETTWRSPEMAH